MATKTIRTDFHKLIDDFSDDEVLEHFYEMMRDAKSFPKRNKYESWDDLPEEKKKDLISAVEEIRHQYNLVPNKEAMEQARKWIKK